MKNLINWFMGEESGQGMVEYGLILVLVSIAVIAALTTLNGSLKDVFTKISNSLAK